MADRAFRRSALLDAALLVGILVVLLIVVHTAWAMLSGASFLQFGAVVAGLFIGSWPMLLAFTLVTLLVALTGWSRAVRFRLALPSAVVAWLLGQVGVAVRDGLPLPDALLWGIFGVPLFLVTAFAAGLIAAPVAAALPRRPAEVPAPSTAGSPAEPSSRSAASIVRAVALGLGSLLILSLPWQWFRAYFTLFGGTERVASPEQAAQYLVTVLLAAALLILAAVLARRQGRSLVGPVVAFGLLVLIAFLCQVPRGSLWLEAPPAPVGPTPGEPGGGIPADCAYDANRPGCGG